MHSCASLAAPYLQLLTISQEADAVGAQQSKAVQKELQLLGAAFQLKVIPDLHMSP